MPDQDPVSRGAGAVYVFRRRGRSAAAMLAAAAWLFGLAALHLVLGASWWLIAVLALPVLPVLRDLWSAASAGLQLDGRSIRWHSGRRRGAARLPEIARVRLDTRWDFSVRATLVLKDGTRIRLPQEATPPHRILEAELEQRGLSCERHHFNLL